MHLILTLIAFLLLTASMAVLRLRWAAVSRTAKQALFGCALLSLTLSAIHLFANWSFTFQAANVILPWSTLASYELLLLLLTLLPPHVLSIVLASVLLLPVLSSSSFLPLSEIFDRIPATTTTMSDTLFWEKQAFPTNSTAYTGVDVSVYSHYRWAPFVRHRRRIVRFLNTQCNTALSSATLEPDGRSVRMVCPAWPGEQGLGGTDLVVPLQ